MECREVLFLYWIDFSRNAFIEQVVSVWGSGFKLYFTHQGVQKGISIKISYCDFIFPDKNIVVAERVNMNSIYNI